MRDRQAFEALQRLEYIGRTRNNVTHAGNGREVHLPKLKCIFQTNEVFEYLGNSCLPNQHTLIGNTEATLFSRYEEGMARLKLITIAGYDVVSN
jgi:hypothetical protein